MGFLSEVSADNAVMNTLTETSSAEHPELRGAEFVDNLYTHELQTSSTIQDVHERMRTIVTMIGTDGEMGERAQELSDGLQEATDNGNGNIRLEDDLGAGVLGQNTMGTKDSMMLRNQLSPEAITVDARYTLDTVLHENSSIGHAGQDPSAWSTVAVVTPQGDFHEPTTMIEGNVVVNVSNHIGQQREGLPQETYLVGAGLVEELGAETVNSYIQKGKANVGNFIQVEFWERNPNLTLKQMFEDGEKVGMPPELVLEEAQRLGKVPSSSVPQTTLVS